MDRLLLTSCFLLMSSLYLSGANAAAIADGVEPTGVVLVSAELFRSLNYGAENAIEVERVDEHTYLSLTPIDDDFTNRVPNCFKLFQFYRESNLKYFQAIANKKCADFIGCWCFPGCPCITFVVKPTLPLCLPKLSLAAQRLPVCELPIPKDFPSDFAIA